MECAQINVTGGSGTATPATVSIPGAYAVRASIPGVWGVFGGLTDACGVM
jgi:hypothetical protein